MWGHRTLPVLIALLTSSLIHAQTSPQTKVQSHPQVSEPTSDGWLGAELITSQAGSEVLSVDPAGPAHRAGLAVGDTILSVGDRDVHKLDWNTLTRRLIPGGRLTLRVSHGFARTLTVVGFPRTAATLPVIGAVAPPLKVFQWLNTSDDGQHREQAFGDGHVYVLDFTANWCSGCPAMYPILESLAQRYASRGLRVLYVTALWDRLSLADSVGQDVALGQVQQYIDLEHLHHPVAVLATPGYVAYSGYFSRLAHESEEAFGYHVGLPRPIVIDGAGIVRAATVDSAELDRAVTAVLPPIPPARGGSSDTIAVRSRTALTELPAIQCQTLIGTDGFHCYENSAGWILAKTRAHAESTAADIATLNADFQRYFVRPAPRFAAVTDTDLVSKAMMARLRALGADGAIPWPVDPRFERLGVMNHELGHIYYNTTFAGPGAPWMREATAILMERVASTRSRYCTLADILRSPERDHLLIPLATLFSMPHPGHADTKNDQTLGVQGGIQITGSFGPSPAKSPANSAAGGATPPPACVPDPPGRHYSVSTVFYEEDRSVIDFLIAQSQDSSIFRAITDDAGKGTRMDDWLRRDGARYHLPSSVEGLDRAWRSWLVLNVEARTGHGTPPPWCDSTTAPVMPLPGSRPVLIVACGTTPADFATLRQGLTAVAAALPLYGHLTGVPYPWPTYTMKVVSGRGQGGGSGTARGAAFDMPFPDARTARDRPAISAKVIVHELAHRWGSHGGAGAGWLTEGWSDFMAGQVWGAAGGPRAEEEFLFFYNTKWDDNQYDAPLLRTARGGLLGAPSEWFSIPWPGAQIWERPMDHELAYYRGALVLWMLQQYLGEARFWAAVHAYLIGTTGSDANAAFLRATQRATGEDLGWFIQEWVHGPGYPRFTVAARYDTMAHHVTLQVQQATPVFRMPVTVRVGTPTGDVLAHATMDAATQTLVVDHVPQAPTYVVFDDGDAVVKTLDFPQPTAWLVAQLRLEAHPWQTWWVVEQLRDRARHDPAATAALVVAAREGRYALTRTHALVAVGMLSAGTGTAVITPATALAAMTMGTHDTAVIVRRAAVRGLAVLGTPAAVAVERSLFLHDPSDQVRADAVHDLLMTPATSAQERQALFAQALRWPPTYEDLVPLAAVSALSLAGQCDTATMETFRAALRQPGGAATLQRVMDVVVPMFGSVAGLDPTCAQTFAAQFPP